MVMRLFPVKNAVAGGECFSIRSIAAGHPVFGRRFHVHQGRIERQATIREGLTVAAQPLGGGEDFRGVGDESDRPVPGPEQVRDALAGAVEIVHQDRVGVDSVRGPVHENCRHARLDIRQQITVAVRRRNDYQAVYPAGAECADYLLLAGWVLSR